jgi:hypothetical protein
VAGAIVEAGGVAETAQLDAHDRQAVENHLSDVASKA